MAERERALTDRVLEGDGALPGGDLLEVASAPADANLAEAAEPVALAVSRCARLSR